MPFLRDLCSERVLDSGHPPLSCDRPRTYEPYQPGLRPLFATSLHKHNKQRCRTSEERTPGMRSIGTRCPSSLPRYPSHMQSAASGNHTAFGTDQHLPLQIEGRGNGIKTNVVNNVDIAKALERPPECKRPRSSVLFAQVTQDLFLQGPATHLANCVWAMLVACEPWTAATHKQQAYLASAVRFLVTTFAAPHAAEQLLWLYSTGYVPACDAASVEPPFLVLQTS